jgi:hypothetical protein
VVDAPEIQCPLLLLVVCQPLSEMPSSKTWNLGQLDLIVVSPKSLGNFSNPPEDLLAAKKLVGTQNFGTRRIC